MKIGVFSSKNYDREYLSSVNQHYGFELDFLEARLSPETMTIAQQYDVVSVFVNDVVDKTVLDVLSNGNVKHVALRCAGFNNVDWRYAKTLGIEVSRVPAYSPQAVAEHTLALIFTLNRKTHKAYNRVKENNFNLEGLLGFNLSGKTVGIIGTGKIGKVVANALIGFGCEVVAYDPEPDADLTLSGVEYISLPELFTQSDVITLHCPLQENNQHMINSKAISEMKPGVMLINTSRGGLIDTKAVIAGLKTRQIGFLGLDVYEMESELFFEDLSCEIIQDDVFERLSGFPNVLITGHQGFFTHEALSEIASTTLENIEQARKSVTPATTFLTASD